MKREKEMEGATRAFVPPPCINERFWWRGVKQDFEPRWRDGVLLYFLALFSPRKLLASYVVGLVVLFFLFIFHLSVIPALFSFAGSFPANPFRNSGKFKLHQILVPVLVPPAVVVLEVVQYSLVHSTSTFLRPTLCRTLNAGTAIFCPRHITADTRRRQ